MEHFAHELRTEGFEVDHRHAATLHQGLLEHRADFAPAAVVAMEPHRWDTRERFARWGVELVRNDRFLCHPSDFAEWASGKKRLTMEDFYRWQRRRFDLLMEPGLSGAEPVGGQWNFDHDNREPPPRDGRAWPAPQRFELDHIDRAVLGRLPAGVMGAEPDGTWPVTRAQALVRLDEFIHTGLPLFGPHEDAMLAAEWKLAHSVLASSMNIGLLHPLEVAQAAEDAYRRGEVPLASAEGFIRQVIGWREYVWGVYWLWMPEYAAMNRLEIGRAHV